MEIYRDWQKKEGRREAVSWRERESKKLRKLIFSHCTKEVWNLMMKERENILLIRQTDVDNSVFLAIRSN